MVEEKNIIINNVEYIVSSDGKVFSTNECGRAKYHQEIQQRLNPDGYAVITTGVTGNRRTTRVHRMVAEAFIQNTYNLPEVNHKNCIRDDNRVENLEWSTHSDNVEYSAKLGHYKRFGEANSNFGNDTLKKKYSEDPELSKLNNSRPGSKNGRCVPVTLFDTIENINIDFDYLRLAAKYIIDNKFCRVTNLDSVSTRLTICATENKLYFNRFKVIKH